MDCLKICTYKYIIGDVKTGTIEQYPGKPLGFQQLFVYNVYRKDSF